MKFIRDVTIQKLVHGGQGLTHDPTTGTPIFVWNALPNEVVDLAVTKEKKNHWEAKTTMVHHSHSERTKPLEEAFLSTSPWQIMSWQLEQEQKLEIIKETLQTIGKIKNEKLADLPIVGDEGRQFGYRNKMEFSFTQDKEGRVQLAFFKRGSKEMIAVGGSMLAFPWINETARHILLWIHQQELTLHNLKSVIVRGTEDGKTIAALYIKDKLEFKTYPELLSCMDGFQIYYSTHKSPASVPTELLYSTGDDFLTDTIHGRQLQYGLHSFFQVNLPIFEQTLNDIKEFIPDNSDVLDFYSGVGSIALPLASQFASATLVDNSEEAIAYAQRNIARMDAAENISAKAAPAEKVVETITSDAFLIVDPPRAGLHKNVIKRILEVTPDRIAYLSCNVATQARDIALLSETYTIKSVKAFNFFPRTPHTETLCLLEKA